MKKKASMKTRSAALAGVSTQAKLASARHEAHANELLALIARRIQRIEEDFFDVGTALRELKEKKLFVALGFRTFDAMLAKRVPMGRSQAYRLIAIATKVTREDAVALGEEKAYSIARLVAVTPEADTVASVLGSGVRVGKSKRSARRMSTREIDAAKRSITAQNKKPDPAERDAKRQARAAQAALRARRIRATAAIEKAMGRWWAIVRIPVEDLPSLVGER